jgi:hypothetical protein
MPSGQRAAIAQMTVGGAIKFAAVAHGAFSPEVRRCELQDETGTFQRPCMAGSSKRDLPSVWCGIRFSIAIGLYICFQPDHNKSTGGHRSPKAREGERCGQLSKVVGWGRFRHGY